MKDLVDVVERRADLQLKVCLTDEVRVHIVGKLPRDVEHISRLNRLRGSVILLPRHAKTQSFELVCGIHRVYPSFAINLISISCVGNESRGVTTSVLATCGAGVP